MRKFVLITAFSLAAATFQASAANIITFADKANSCGGAVMCSSNGTTGYFNNGMGQAFDLSTINSWFQIDTSGTNKLATQTEAEPDGGAGGFLVINNTGMTVTTFSLTINDSFTSSTPSVHFCSGSSGPLCDNFQVNKGALTGTSESLSGPDFFSCSNGTQAGQTCTSSAGSAAADFTPGNVTYTWNGLNLAANETFDITFASWQSGNVGVITPGAQSAVPEPSPLSLVAAGLGLLGFGISLKASRSTPLARKKV